MEQIADVHVPEIMEEIVEVAKIVQQERDQQHIVEEIVDAPVPQFLEEMVEVIKAIPQERISERIFEQVVNVPEETLEVVKSFSQDVPQKKDL